MPVENDCAYCGQPTGKWGRKYCLGTDCKKLGMRDARKREEEPDEDDYGTRLSDGFDMLSEGE